jgi:hypothetical protein
MEEVAEGLVRFSARALLAVVRFLLWFVWELLCETLLWYVGWPVVRVVTLGRFPKQGITQSEQEEPLVLFLVAGAGFVTLLTLAYMLGRYVAA